MKKVSLFITILFTFFSISIYETIEVYAQSTSFIIPEGMNMESRVPAGTVPMSSMDLTRNQDFTGNISIPIPIVSLGGVDVQISYNSKNIATDVRTENRYAPSGPVGFGWQLSYGSISAEINNSLDPSDDKYYYNGPDGSFEIQQKSDGTFLISDYKVWKINRIVSSDTVVGWKITKEDGTIFRYGNYNKNLTNPDFILDYSPTNATRFLLGNDGIVSNPAITLLTQMHYIPYQWDVSNIEDIYGNQTTVIYNPTKKFLYYDLPPLYSSNIQYTSESYPQKILNNRGGEIEFKLGMMDSDEYYNYPQTYQQNIFGKKFIDSILIKGDGVIFKKIDLNYFSSNFLGIKKKYLKEIIYKDAAGSPLPSYKFDYYLSGTDINPGAIEWIMDPSGGKVTYTYQVQQLSNVDLSAFHQIPYMCYYNEAGYGLNDDGMAGKDFVVIRGQDKSLTVYRLGPNGWFNDQTFPYLTNIVYCKVANDFVIVDDGTHLYAVKRTKGGWKDYNLDNYLPAPTNDKLPEVIGLGNDYFVVKHNAEGEDLIHYPLWRVSILKFESNTLNRYEASARFADGKANYYGEQCQANGEDRFVSIRAFCGENYMVLASRDEVQGGTVFSHFRYSSAGIWDELLIEGDAYQGANWGNYDINYTQPHRVYIGKNFVVLVLDEVVCPTESVLCTLKVYRRDDYTSGLHLIDTKVETLGDVSVVVGDDFYAYSCQRYSYLNGADEMVIRVWDGNTFSDANRSKISEIFPGITNPTNSTHISLTQMDDRLIINWNDNNGGDLKVGYTTFNPAQGTWSEG